MNKKDKGQAQAIQWSRKTKDKHMRYNGQKRQRTNRGDTMYKKDKGQTQAIQWTNTGNKMDKKEKRQAQAIQYTKKTKNKHRPYNIQKTQRKSTGHTMCKKGKGQT